MRNPLRGFFRFLQLFLEPFHLGRQGGLTAQLLAALSLGNPNGLLEIFYFRPIGIVLIDQTDKVMMAFLERARDISNVASHVGNPARQRGVFLDHPGDFFVLRLNDLVETEIDDRNIGKPAYCRYHRQNSGYLDPSGYAEMTNVSAAIQDNRTGVGRSRDRLENTHLPVRSLSHTRQTTSFGTLSDFGAVMRTLPSQIGA